MTIDEILESDEKLFPSDRALFYAADTVHPCNRNGCFPPCPGAYGRDHNLDDCLPLSVHAAGSSGMSKFTSTKTHMK